jgi:hypothetical protein
LPKRALSASATWPAGTIGICVTGATEFGISGDCDCEPTGLLGANGSPPPWRGVIKPVDGVAENSELCPADCADAAPGIVKAATNAMA